MSASTTTYTLRVLHLSAFGVSVGALKALGRSVTQVKTEKPLEDQHAH